MSPSAKPSRKTLRRLVLGALGGLAAVVVVVFALGYWLLETASGRAQLIAVLAETLEAETGLVLDMAPIEGSLLGRFSISKASLADDAGAFLELSDLRVEWAPLDLLLRRRLTIAEITLAETTLHRLPAVKGNADEAATGLPTLPSLPLAISLESLSAAKLRLGPEVAGQLFELSFDGGFSAAPEGPLRLKALLQRSGHPDSRLEALVEIQPAANLLELSLVATEAGDGLFQAALKAAGLPLPPEQPIVLKLEGSGSLDDWRGHLTADLGASAAVESDIVLQAEERVQLGLKGEAAFAALLPEDFIALKDETAHFDLKAVWDPAVSQGELDLSELSFAGLRLSGTAEIAEEGRSLEGDLAFAGDGDGVWESFIAPLSLGNMAGRIDFDRDDDQTQARVTLSLRSLQLPDTLQSEGAALSVLLAQGSDDDLIAFEGDLQVEDFVAADPAIETLLGSSPGLRISGNFAPDADYLDLAALALSGGAVRLDGSGGMTLSSLDLFLEGGLSLPDLAPLTPITGQALAGAFGAGYRLEGNLLEPTLKAALDGAFERLDLAIPEAQALLGKSPDLMFAGRFDSGNLVLDNLDIQGSALSLSSQGSLDAAGELNLGYALSLPSLSLLPGGFLQSGALTAEGRLSGSLEAPGLRGSAVLSDLAGGDLAVSHLGIGYGFSDLTGAPKGQIAFKGDTPIGSLDGDLDLALSGEQLVISALRLEAPGTTLSGKLDIALSPLGLAGQIDVDSRDLQPLSAIAGLPLSGRAKGAIHLRQKGEQQGIAVSLQAEQLGLESLSLASLQARIEAPDILGKGPLEAVITAKGLRQAPLILEDLSLKAAGNATAFTLEASAMGDLFGPLEVSSHATVTLGDLQSEFQLEDLSGRALGHPLRQLAPLRISLGPSDRLQMEDLDLSFGPGSLRGTARIEPEAVAVNLQADDLPLSAMKIFLPQLPIEGEVDAKFTLAGKPSRPAGDFQIETTTLRADSSLKAATAAAIERARMSLTGRLGDGLIEIDGRVAGLAEQDLELRGSFPMVFSLAPFAIEPSDSAPLDGSLRFSGPIDQPAAELLPSQHLLQGILDLDLALAGTLSAPTLSGHLRLSDSRYENLLSGTLLDPLELEVLAEGDRLTLSRFEAGDGEEGRVTGSGNLSFANLEDPVVESSLLFENATLLRRDDARLALEGTLAFEGPVSAPALTGRLATKGARIILGGGNPAGLVELKVREVNGPQLASLAEEEAAAGPPVPIALDLEISLPNQIFVSGPIFESEWAGEFKIGGTSEDAKIEGALRTIKGQVDFSGRIFEITKGQVMLDPVEIANPFIDVVALYRKSDFEAEIRISGRAENPKIEFTSRPVYPQDEIIARILFNKPVSELTAVESLELAATVARLASGQAGGGGLVGKLREIVALDVLRVGQSDEGAAQVSAGKYLTDNVYVGVDQGTAAGSTKATVEIELTPGLTLETDVGADSSGRVNLRYKWNY